MFNENQIQNTMYRSIADYLTLWLQTTKLLKLHLI
jgi:hypothetical protein